jgi:hypothetical protein
MARASQAFAALREFDRVFVGSGSQADNAHHGAMSPLSLKADIATLPYISASCEQQTLGTKGPSA